MGAAQLNPLEQNNEIGFYFVKSRRVVLDALFGEMATWVKSTTAGTIVFSNSQNGEVSVIETEAGEALPIVCDKILTSATIDSILETTTATGLFWIVTPHQVGKPL